MISTTKIRHMFSNEDGFGLVESLLVMAIIGLILVFSMPALTKSNHRNLVEGELQKIINAFETARNDAITGKKVADITPEPAYGDYFWGWGVRIDPVANEVYSYEIWYDDSDVREPFEEIPPERISTTTFSYITLTDIAPAPTDSFLEIRFSKLYGVYYSNLPSASQSAVISATSIYNIDRSITIFPSGRIVLNE